MRNNRVILTNWKRRTAVIVAAGMIAAGIAAMALGAAQNGSPGPPEKRQKNLIAGEKEAKKLILLMDKDHNGKVSKQEFMSFMEAEFDRLDKDKNGSLDVQELTQARVRTSSAHGR